MTSIICRNGSAHRHASIAEVRSCYADTADKAKTVVMTCCGARFASVAESLGHTCPRPVEAPVRPATCDHEIFDGNEDDPSFAYCGLTPAHAGAHGKWYL